MNALGTAADRLMAQLGDRAQRDAPSAELTTYRCGGPLGVLVRAGTLDDLRVVAGALGPSPEIAVLVIGRGSNLLVSDDGFDGVAIVLVDDFERIVIDPATARVHAGAAVALPVLARRSAKDGVGGLEFFVGIPGSVGGAVRMNAGGHGADTDAVIVTADVFALDTGQVRAADRGALALGYRTSGLSARDVVVGATFAGEPDDPEAGAARIDEIVRWRREHQPGGQNAGSVFTNPPGDAAGRLIEASGCKGLRIGGAVVSEKHANFFVADPGARAADVYALVRTVQQRVAETTGVQLHPELRLVGFPLPEEVGG